MTTVTPTIPTPASTVAPTGTTTNASGSASALNQLSGNFDTFLQLLTTQLQNQDPTAPMDSNQFTQQLVEFSGVEQQINTNTDLQTLISQGQSSGTNGAVNYLGKTVTLTNGNAALSNGQASWTYSLAAPAASNALTITDANGKVVYAGSGETGQGSHQFNWNGQDNAGNQLPDGTYTLAVTPAASDGSTVGSAVASLGTVTQIDLTGTSPQLMIGSMEFPISAVSAVSGS